MPQAKHGGRGVFVFAVAASKFVGTGLENEQIVQIQVTLLNRGVLVPLPIPRGTGEEVELREVVYAAS